MAIFVDNKKVSVANETSNRNTLNICLLFNVTPFIMAAIMNACADLEVRQNLLWSVE